MFKIRQILMVVLLLAQGIFEALKEARDFTQLEEKVHRLTQQAGGVLLTFALEEIDQRLMAQREKTLKVIGSRERTLISTMGEIKIKRRMYRDEAGKYVFLLDQALGLASHRRISQRLQELVLDLATEMPFRRAAKVLSYLVPAVSPMAVWSTAQAAGEEACKEADKLKKDVFEKGVVPKGQRVVDRLNIEGDEIRLKQQRGKSKYLDLKLLVGYEGKTGPRRRLENRHTVAGITDGRGIWEEGSCVFGQKWALPEVKQIRIGGDGASWIKRGVEHFPGATYYLDLFHLRKRLTEALSNTAAYTAVTDGLARLDKEAVLRALDQEMSLLKGARKKRVRELKKYLLDNWSGIARLPEEERLGTIEGQVRHTIARRMKRVGARWTLKGAGRMGRLLAAKANGELSRYVAKPKSALENLLSEQTFMEKVSACHQKDLEAWLRATMPALYGPFAGRPWIKYVLKEIASVQWPA